MARKLFSIPELMTRIIGFATIHSIVAIGGTCVLGRDYMQETLGGFIQAMLDPYFPSLGTSFIFLHVVILIHHYTQTTRSCSGKSCRLPMAP